VADTRGFQTRISVHESRPAHTDQLRLVERFSRPDFDTLKYEVTIETPAHTLGRGRPVTCGGSRGEEQPRHICQENRS